MNDERMIDPPTTPSDEGDATAIDTARSVDRRSFIRWIGGATVGVAAALSGRLDLLGTGGTRSARAAPVAPEDSGFERWGNMLLVPADADPVPIKVTSAPAAEPVGPQRAQVITYDSVEQMASNTSVGFYRLGSESPTSPEVEWLDSGHPYRVGAILSTRDGDGLTDFREFVLSAHPRVPTPYGILAPPINKIDEPSATWPPLIRTQFLGNPALLTALPDGLVVHWVEGHTYFLLQAIDRASGVSLADLERGLVAV